MYRGGYTYIMTNAHHNVLYVGVTSDLRERVEKHRLGTYKDSFTDKYNVEKLLYYEGFDGIEEAITREKQLKRWTRVKKEFLINTMNPTWRDLYDDISNW